MTSKIAIIPMALNLTQKHMAVVQSAGYDKGIQNQGRDQEMAELVSPLASFALFMEDDALKTYIDGFLLGYTVRGIDSLLDFDISRNEAVETIMQSFTARLTDPLTDDMKEAFGDDK